MSLVHNLSQMARVGPNATEEDYVKLQMEQEQENKKFMREKIKTLVEKLNKRLEKWINGNEKEFLSDAMEEIEQCLEVPGGPSLLKKVNTYFF